MTAYRRAYLPNTSWFFTVNLAQRKDNPLLVDNIDLLRQSFAYVMTRHPLRIEAVVILPDWGDDKQYPIRAGE